MIVIKPSNLFLKLFDKKLTGSDFQRLYNSFISFDFSSLHISADRLEKFSSIFLPVFEICMLGVWRRISPISMKA